MAACGYEFYLLVLNVSLTRSLRSLDNKSSSPSHNPATNKFFGTIKNPRTVRK